MYRLLILLIVFPLKLIGQETEVIKNTKVYLSPNASKDNVIGEIFEKIEGVRVVQEKQKAETSWFGVPIVCSSNDIKQKLVSHLEKNRIQTRNYFAGNILMHPAYVDIDDFEKYPEANKVLDRVFFVGCSPTITASMISYIEEVVEKFKTGY